MDFRQNALIAWPKSRDCEDNADSGKRLIPKQQDLVNFRFERVLYVDVSNDELWAIDVSDPKAWPAYYKVSELADHITADDARIVVGYEPYPIITLTDEELGLDFAKYIAYRDEAWKLIEKLVQAEIRTLFSRRIRATLIAEIAKTTGRDKIKYAFSCVAFGNEAA